ncbi:MAG: hypothetical protein JWP01_3478 [Myxococcales bacterium]|nr:hypothetical protein [Myxococcales bacterium]
MREATAADRPEVEALIAEMIPGCDVAARWKWLYDTNPGGKALTWLAIAPTGEVAGCTSFFPFRLWLDGEEVRAALGGDGYVRPAFRRRGLGGLMHDASRRGMPAHSIGCMYGAPGAMNLTPLKHGGSREVGAVCRYVRPLRVGPPLVGALVARASRPWFAPKLEPMQANDPRIDAVWLNARRDLKLAAVRDTAFYQWRFRDAPAQREPAYVITDAGQPIGACALESLYDGKELHIVDLVAIPGAWHSCLRAITRHAIDHTLAATLSIKLFSIDARSRHMWRSGFVERDGKPFLCMIPTDGDRRFLDPQRWFYTGADSDLDSLS